MRRLLTTTLVGLVLTTAAAMTALPASARGDDTVQQIGTYDYLTSPADYAGLAPLRALGPRVTLGLGTFDDLDGELVIVGGRFYRVGTDGVPALTALDRTSPFAQSIDFRAERSGPVPPGTTCTQLLSAVNALAGTDAGLIAVRVRGTFTDLVTRSVPAQATPYAPLAQVVATQTLFPLGSRRAVLVGFRTGQDLAGTGAPGLHLHGLTADRSAGGHVISCVAGPDVQLSVERASAVRIVADASAG